MCSSSAPGAARCAPRRRAFTLIELLVVVSIVAVLLSIGLPAMSGARDAARASVCLGNIRQIALAALMYAQEQRRESWVGYGGAGKDRKVLLYPYTNSGKNNADQRSVQIWQCPKSAGSVHPLTGIETIEAGYGFNTNLNWAPLRRIMQPSQTVALADGGIGDDMKPRTVTHLMAPSLTTTGSLCRPNPRHRGTVNVGWVDGHASTEIMQPDFYPDGPGKWFGNGISDPNDPDYMDKLWDLD